MEIQNDTWIDGISLDWTHGGKNYKSKTSSSLILYGCLAHHVQLCILYVFHLLHSHSQTRSEKARWLQHREWPTDPKAFWVINNTSGKISQKKELHSLLEYSRKALGKRSKGGRGRTQPVIYGPLLFRDYFAGVSVLIEHMGLSLHQGFLTLWELNLDSNQ